MKEQIECACGCGQKMDKTDKWGRSRKFISGHNRRKYEQGYDPKKAWVKKNPKWKRDNRRARGRQRKIHLMSLLGTECEYCGYEYDGDNSAAFDFHHRDPDTKKFDICMKLENSLKSLEEEVKKCDLICSNCHRILHARE